MTNDSARSEALKLEEEAGIFYDQKNLEEAFQAFREAGFLYQQIGDHAKAFSCFARGARCEKIRVRLEPLLEAATMSEFAADEAMILKKYADAKWLYREAGLLFEKEGEFEQYSKSFVGSQEAHLYFLQNIFIAGKKQLRNERPDVHVGFYGRVSAFVAWIFGLLSRFVWNYGEAPLRPVSIAWLVILASACLYYLHGRVDWHGYVRTLNFTEAIYMSIATFTTLGYGDFVPLGWTRVVASCEAFSGILLTPLFLIALTRRYLRVYR